MALCLVTINIQQSRCDCLRALVKGEKTDKGIQTLSQWEMQQGIADGATWVRLYWQAGILQAGDIQTQKGSSTVGRKAPRTREQLTPVCWSEHAYQGAGVPGGWDWLRLTSQEVLFHVLSDLDPQIWWWVAPLRSKTGKMRSDVLMVTGEQVTRCSRAKAGHCWNVRGCGPSSLCPGSLCCD